MGSLRNSNAQLYSMKPLNWTDDPINILGILISDDKDTLLELNYDSIITKVRNVLNSWANRSISLYGKVCVVNTLVSSLFVYKMMVLPTMPRKYLNMFEEEVNKYLWGGKRAKISMKALQLGKKSGGLNLVDLRKREIALKCTWVKTMEQDSKTASMANYFLDRTMGLDIWHTNLHYKDITALFQDTFWRDVLIAWAEVNFNKNPYSQQTIWYNSNIRIENRPYFWCAPYKKGLLWVNQVINECGIIPVEQAYELFDLNYMQLYSIWDSIPKEYKSRPTQEGAYLTWYERCVIDPALSRKIYTLLANCDSCILTAKANQWTCELNESITNAKLLEAIRYIYCN